MNDIFKISPYSLFTTKSYRTAEEFFTKENVSYDVFISAYTDEDIVTKTFENFQATKKYWLLFPEYNFDINSLNIKGNIFYPNIKFIDNWEIEYILDFIDTASLKPDMSLCIDISGFIKPYMIFLIHYLKEKGYQKIDIIYSEPQSYRKSSDTEFSQNDILSTRDILMLDQEYREPAADDLFIVNAGYDSRLIKNVLNDIQVKETTVLIGYPSLQPIMYQENLINIEKAQTALKIDFMLEPLTAPANNPFESAKVISDYIKKYMASNKNINNIYLSVLATKAQALGLLIFYMCEEKFFNDREISIHFRYPFTSHYSANSSLGIFRINKYSLEFDKMEEWF